MPPLPPHADWADVVDRLGQMHGRAPHGRGRVLSVKFGYNPNSSSVGSVITVLLWTSVFAVSALNIMNALLHDRHRLRLPGPASSATGEPSVEPTEPTP
jgi:hypothetical protein